MDLWLLWMLSSSFPSTFGGIIHANWGVSLQQRLEGASDAWSDSVLRFGPIFFLVAGLFHDEPSTIHYRQDLNKALQEYLICRVDQGRCISVIATSTHFAS